MHYRFLLLLSLAIGGIVFIQIDRFRSFQSSASPGQSGAFAIGSDHGPAQQEPAVITQTQTPQKNLEKLPTPDFGNDIPDIFVGTKEPPNLAKMGKPVSGTQATNKDIYPPGTFVKEAKNNIGEADGTDLGLKTPKTN